MSNMNDYEVTIMNDTTGEVVKTMEERFYLVTLGLHEAIERRQYAEALLWRYELGFWLLACALVLDLAFWLYR